MTSTPKFSSTPTSLVDLVRCFAWASGSLSPAALWTALDLAHEFDWPECKHARWLVVGPPRVAPDPAQMNAHERVGALRIGERFAASRAPESAELNELLRALLEAPSNEEIRAPQPGARRSSARTRSPSAGADAFAA